MYNYGSSDSPFSYWAGNKERYPRLAAFEIDYDKLYSIKFPQKKMNLFVLSGHGSESFAAFLNGVILQQKTTRQ